MKGARVKASNPVAIREILEPLSKNAFLLALLERGLGGLGFLFLNWYSRIDNMIRFYAD